MCSALGTSSPAHERFRPYDQLTCLSNQGQCNFSAARIRNLTLNIPLEFSSFIWPDSLHYSQYLEEKEPFESDRKQE